MHHGKGYFSNHLEILYQHLKKNLFTNSSPFQKRLIVVPNYGVKHWLLEKLAEDSKPEEVKEEKPAKKQKKEEVKEEKEKKKSETKPKEKKEVVIEEEKKE